MTSLRNSESKFLEGTPPSMRTELGRGKPSLKRRRRQASQSPQAVRRRRVQDSHCVTLSRRRSLSLSFHVDRFAHGPPPPLAAAGDARFPPSRKGSPACWSEPNANVEGGASTSACGQRPFFNDDARLAPAWWRRRRQLCRFNTRFCQLHFWGSPSNI